MIIPQCCDFWYAMNVLVKNSIQSGVITSQGKTGDGVVMVDNFPVYIPQGIRGERIEFKVIRVDKRRAYGKLLRVIEPSIDRVQPQCKVANQCGGCQLQHQSQASQIEFKSALLVTRLSRFIDLSKTKVHPILFGDDQWAMRNKMQFAFGLGHDGLEIGLYAPRSHRVVATDRCEVMSEPMNRILAGIQSWWHPGVPVFNEHTGHGALRHVTIRHSYVTGELMVILTVAKSVDLRSFITAMSAISGVCSLYVSHQSDPTSDAVLGDDTLLWGTSTIRDVVCGRVCFVSPKTFMQANARLVHRLYETVIGYVIPQGVLLDLYCGAGVLTCVLASRFDRVIGVDNNASAIRDARLNAKENGLDIEFVCQDAGAFLNDFSVDDMTVIVDPPRQGLHMVDELVKKKPKQVIYVSCYPDTLGRDLRAFVAGGYRISSIQGVDMFCHTVHIECVVVLEFLGKSE